MLEDKILTILKEVANIEVGKRLVVGIDGLSRSGKTTFVKQFNQQLLEMGR